MHFIKLKQCHTLVLNYHTSQCQCCLRRCHSWIAVWWHGFHFKDVQARCPKSIQAFLIFCTVIFSVAPFTHMLFITFQKKILPILAPTFLRSHQIILRLDFSYAAFCFWALIPQRLTTFLALHIVSCSTEVNGADQGVRVVKIALCSNIMMLNFSQPPNQQHKFRFFSI